MERQLAPVTIAFGEIADTDAIGQMKRGVDPYGDAGEHIRQRTLQRQSEHDGEHARRCERARYRQSEHRSEHDGDRRCIDGRREKVGA